MTETTEDIASDRVLTVEEGIEIKQRIAGKKAVKTWRWMGNFGDPSQAAMVANQPPACGAGEVLLTINGSLTPAWMFF
ncbi:hypothetical protein ACFWWM_03220 [Streptomyces sp. NPDC058682]|uniref:hypothetical protein n=1 Tax=unclassified Streptomyces TaxID=2593676 RepID=UPI0035E31CC8